MPPFYWGQDFNDTIRFDLSNPSCYLEDFENHQRFSTVRISENQLTEGETLMEIDIIIIYVICDEFLRAMNHHDDPQAHMSDAEVMTVALIAMLYYGGNYAKARKHLGCRHYMPHMLGKSRFSRRLSRLGYLFIPLFAILAEGWKAGNAEQIYSLDTFPIPVCDNIRIRRARIYQDESYRGYIASKKRYFYGLKVHILVTRTGEPVEFFLTPGAFSDVGCLDQFEFDLPAGAIIYADKIYNHYLVEDCLQEDGQVTLSPFRKRNSKRPEPPWIRYLQQHYRKIVETSASLVERLLPKSIHATNAAGFELKVILFIVAFSFDRLFKVAT
jgi:hypothetical protein